MTGPLKMAVGVLLAEGQLVMAMMYAMMRERTVRSSKRLCIILLLREPGLAELDSRATTDVSGISVNKTLLHHLAAFGGRGLTPELQLMFLLMSI